MTCILFTCCLKGNEFQLSATDELIIRGATTAEKLRVPRFDRLGLNTGALVPRPKAGLGVGCGRGLSLPLRVRGITPRKFMKTQMLNPAFW